jgi:hypothetical protein
MPNNTTSESCKCNPKGFEHLPSGESPCPMYDPKHDRCDYAGLCIRRNYESGPVIARWMRGEEEAGQR